MNTNQHPERSGALNSPGTSTIPICPQGITCNVSDMGKCCLRENFQLVLLAQTEHTAQIISVIREAKEDFSDKEEWLLVEDLMRIFKKTARTIYTWTKEGKFETLIHGRTTYYRKSDVYKLLKKISVS